MQLTLVDTNLFGCSYDGRELLSFGEVSVRPTFSTGVASRNLMTELTTGKNCLIKVDLQLVTIPFLRVKCTTPANNILQRLRERFHKNVKVSLTFKELKSNYSNANVAHHVDPTPFLCVQGMAIDSMTYSCGDNVTMIDNFSLIHKLTNWNLNTRMTITAIIPDEILSNTKKPNLQPKKITIPQKIFENGLANDVVIVAQNGAEIKAHKSFLFAWSTAFEREFESGMVESRTGRHDMSDVSEPGIMAFLRYLYYEDLEGPNQDAEIAYEMLYAAHKYEVTELEEVMLKLLLKKSDMDFKALSALKIYCFVRNVDSFAQLKSKLIGVLKMKIDEVHALPEYKELFQKNPADAMELSYQFAKATMK